MAFNLFTKHISTIGALIVLMHSFAGPAARAEQDQSAERNILLHESVPQVVAPNGRISAKVHRWSAVSRSWIFKIYKLSEDDFRPKKIFPGWPVHASRLVLRSKRSFLPFVSWSEHELLLVGTINSQIDEENDLRIVAWADDSYRLLVEVTYRGATALEEVDVRSGSRQVLIPSNSYTRLLSGDDDRYVRRPRRYIQATGYSRSGALVVTEFERPISADEAHPIRRYTVGPSTRAEGHTPPKDDDPIARFRRRLHVLAE